MFKRRADITSFSRKKKVVLIRAGHTNGRLPHALLSLAANLEDEVLILDEAKPSLVLKHSDEIKNEICHFNRNKMKG